jgi:hypothetical protein
LLASSFSLVLTRLHVPSESKGKVEIRVYTSVGWARDLLPKCLGVGDFSKGSCGRGS